MNPKGSVTTSTYVEWDIMLQVIKDAQKASDHRCALLFGIGIYTGLRVGDIKRLRWMDIMEVNPLKVIEQKTSKVRTIPVNEHLNSIIMTAYPEMNPWQDDHLIFRQVWDPFTPIDTGAINIILNNALAPYKIDGNISSHSLRKTFGRRIWENNGKTGEALVMLMELFNHTSIFTTKRYLGIRQQELGKLYLDL